MDAPFFSRFTAAFLSLLVFCCPGPLRAATQICSVATAPGSGIHVEVTSPATSIAPGGFAPVRVKITNGSQRAGIWALEFSEGNFSGSSRVSRFEIRVPAGIPSETWLMVPLSDLPDFRTPSSRLSLELTGPGIEKPRAGGFQLGNGRFGDPATGWVAITESLATKQWGELEARLKGTSPGGIALPLSELPLAKHRALSSLPKRGLAGAPVVLREFPPDSRAFSGFAGLWLRPSDWETLDSARREALRQWILQGGRLFVAAEAGPLRLAGLPEPGESGDAPLGFGRIERTAFQAGSMDLEKLVRQVISLDGAPASASDDDYRTGWAASDLLGKPTLNVPGILLAVGLIAVLIGPVNLLWFAPPNRRHRLFVTVPLLSLGASLLVLTTIILGDGVGGAGIRNALVLLGEGRSQGVLIQEQLSRSRFLFSRQFTLPEEASLAWIQMKDGRHAEPRLFREGGRLGGDWFQSRAVQAHRIQLNFPTRAEVSCRPGAPGSAPELLSTVPDRMDRVFYMDDAGAYWTAPQLETGRPQPLQASTRSAFEEWVREVRADFSVNLSESLAETSHRPGWFYGTLKAPRGGLVLETLDSVRWDRQTVLVLGPCGKGGGK
jgi:hypothetical protein